MQAEGGDAPTQDSLSVKLAVVASAEQKAEAALAQALAAKFGAAQAAKAPAAAPEDLPSLNAPREVVATATGQGPCEGPGVLNLSRVQDGQDAAESGRTTPFERRLCPPRNTKIFNAEIAHMLDSIYSDYQLNTEGEMGLCVAPGDGAQSLAPTVEGTMPVPADASAWQGLPSFEAAATPVPAVVPSSPRLPPLEAAAAPILAPAVPSPLPSMLATELPPMPVPKILAPVPGLPPADTASLMAPTAQATPNYLSESQLSAHKLLGPRIGESPAPSVCAQYGGDSDDEGPGHRSGKCINAAALNDIGNVPIDENDVVGGPPPLYAPPATVAVASIASPMDTLAAFGITSADLGGAVNLGKREPVPPSSVTPGLQGASTIVTQTPSPAPQLRTDHYALQGMQLQSAHSPAPNHLLLEAASPSPLGLNHSSLQESALPVSSPAPRQPAPNYSTLVSSSVGPSQHYGLQPQSVTPTQAAASPNYFALLPASAQALLAPNGVPAPAQPTSPRVYETQPPRPCTVACMGAPSSHSNFIEPPRSVSQAAFAVGPGGPATPCSFAAPAPADVGLPPSLSPRAPAPSTGGIAAAVGPGVLRPAPGEKISAQKLVQQANSEVSLSHMSSNELKKQNDMLVGQIESLRAEVALRRREGRQPDSPPWPLTAA